jgi:putative restriction endonuclease
MFISTSYADIMKRNRLGLKPRWFDTSFVLKGKTVYLSTQWYGNGQYSLMFDDFKNLIATCFGSRYYFDQNENGEFELWKVTSEETEEILESSLNKVIYDFQHLNTAKRDGKLAPHKAIMLLSIMDLISKGKITSPSIMYSEELESTFEEIWEEYVPQDCTFQCIASTPFWHMKGEPFWSISQLNGDTLNSVSGTPSASALQHLQVVGTLSKTTFKLMTIENYRTKLKEALIEKFL